MTDVETFVRLRYGNHTDPGYIDRVPVEIIVAVYRTSFFDANGYETHKKPEDIVERVRSFFEYPNSYPNTIEEYTEAYRQALIRLHQND